MTEMTKHTDLALRRGLAIAAVVDRMTNGTPVPDTGKYRLISELLSAYGYSVGDDALSNYAAKARVFLRTYPSGRKIG